MEIDWRARERELEIEIRFAKQTLKGKEIAATLTVSAPLPVYRGVGPVEANWRGLVEPEQSHARIVGQVPSGFTNKITTKGKVSQEGIRRQRILTIEKELRQLKNQMEGKI